MSAPFQPPPEEHNQIAVAIATKIANEIASFMPDNQQALSQGFAAVPLTFRVTFRQGNAGEAPVVAEMTCARDATVPEQWLLSPSPQTGQLALLAPPQPLGSPGNNGAQYQAPQPPPQQQLPPRQHLPPPDVPPGTNLVQPPQYAPLVGPIAQMEQPMQQQMPTPEQYAAQYNQQQQGQPAPQPRPGRLKRPPMAGDEGTF